jgi:hypothetical protein
MASEVIRITGEPGRKHDYAVERLHDGAFYHPDCDAWRRSQGRVVYARMGQPEEGRYEAKLPELDPDQDYCVHVVDAETQQLVTCQMLDGSANKIHIPRAGVSKGQPTPRNEYHVGPSGVPTQPVPDFGDIASSIRRLAAHWVGMVWAERQYRNVGIGVVCVLAALLLWPRGPSREDVEKARVLAEQRAIRQVLDQDKALGQQIAQRVGVMDQFWDGSALVAEFAGRMDSVDLGGCPQDFQMAYKRHVAAWAAVARAKASNEGFNGAIKGFFTVGLSVLPAMSEVNQAMKEVQSSWSEVQQAAIRHGVAP